MKLIGVIFVLCILHQNVICYKFLAVLPTTSRSHYYIGHNLMKGLAEDGHEVTVISPFKQNKPIKNYNEVFLEHSWEMSRKTMAKNNFVDLTSVHFWDWNALSFAIGMDMTNWTVSSKNFQDFLKVKQHFDVVIVEVLLNDALLALGNYYNAPVIGLSAFGASKFTTDLVGTPNFASYVPYTSNHYTDRMTFWQRMYNSLSMWYEDIALPSIFMPKQQEVMEQIFPDAKNWPSLEEIRRNVSLVLLNTHTTIGTPRPYAPNMIEVGGMQIQKEVEPLSQKVQTFLDEAKDGAIFISLGSQLLLNKIPKDKLNAIVNAFGAYPNYRILIKSDEKVVVPSHKESDVLVEPWFSQQSILAHKNIKLFVSHGGLLSTTETVHFGKPVVGIPFMFDQHLNMYLAEQKGYGVSVPFEVLTQEKLTSAVNKVLGNPSYAEQALLISDRFRDQPLTPLETAKHWVKHIAKNKGAPHLRSVAVDLPFYKLYNLDTKDTLSFLVTIKDRVNASGGDSEHDNLVQVPIKVIVLDENDVVPEFQNVPYETEVLESASPGTRIFNSILVTDKDAVGENLNITCLTTTQKILIKSPQSVSSSLASKATAESYEPCSKFAIELIESNQDRLKAAIILKEKLDYNEQMIYHLLLTATDGIHEAKTGVEIRVKDVQNRPPVFQGSLAAVINEDSPIGTLVMTIQAKDGDHGQPRKIVYDLLTNPMDYFLLDSKTGELHTARPLDREALPDATGIIVLTVRARELIDGQPGSDNSTMAITQASITIHDVNDSPPIFNKKNYFISLAENTPIGTPLPIEINVRDPDVGLNSVFALRLEDVSGVFDVEPKLVTGSSPVSIRIANGTLDYENPNQRKFIVLIIAEETDTVQKLSSTATLTVTVTDANDNRPVFEQETYSFLVSETAPANHLIGTITAKDLDSGRFGTNGIRYSLSGAGSELFHVSNNGAITVAECQQNPHSSGHKPEHQRKKRETIKPPTTAKKVNLTIVGETGVIDVDDATGTTTTTAATELYYPYANIDEVTFRPFFSANDDYMVMSDDSDEETTTAHETLHTNDENHTNELNTIDAQHSKELETIRQTTTKAYENNDGPGHAPCLDYETQPVYFLTYKAKDDNGLGQTSVVSLRIMLSDSNDSPPTCESSLYRASLDEGANFFDPPLFIKVRDADSISDISYRILGNDSVLNLFTIDKHTGQLFIKNTMALDVNHLKSENIFFSVEADDGAFVAVCNVNITIRDVNNHAPKFERDNYMATIAEDTPIGTTVERVHATDLDTGINAKIRYRIQQGSFDDFAIDNRTGLISIARKLDYDKRENYRIEVVASDLGIPSLSGTATVSINLINSNDKDPFFIPATQRAEVREDAAIGKRIYKLVAHDPDVTSNDVLIYEVTEPITAVNKNGKEVTDSQAFKHLFAVDRYGNVTVNGLLDRDFFAVVRLTVVVTDTTAPTLQQGKGLLIVTIIEVNEMPPVFALPWTPSTPKLVYQMLEEQPIGTKLTQLQATDSDSNIEAYHLSANDYLQINNLTGVITTKARIDYESIKQIYVNAYVTDTGVPQLTSTAEIIVDIVNTNDNEPVFSLPDYRFTVAENSVKGTHIGKIDAKDADDGIFGNVTYTLIGDHSSNFNIDPISGAITVQNSSFLDRERMPEASFSAMAVDKAPIATRRSAIVPIYVTIQDVNDNNPIFTQKSYYASVAENAQLNPPAAVLQVNALDADEGIFGEVKYAVVGNDNMLFQLDPNSGILYPSQSLKGKKGQYKLTVEARDGLGFGPNADKTEVVIDVQSVNNYRPIFIMPALSNASVEIQENHATSNYLVMTVKANDEDVGDNGLVKYYLQVNNQNVLETDEFKIDELTGELKLKKDLNREKQDKYELVLVARDQGIPSHFESLRFLTILIVSVSENKPEFPDASNPYKFFIMENSDRGIRIGKIQAFLRDKDPHTTVYYYMLLGNENGAFYVDKKSGDVFTNRSLDREEVDTYHLYILSSKKSDLHISRRQRDELSIEALERDSTVAKVQVKVLDVNDNAPKFEHDVYYAGISAEAAINQLVTTINATDADMGTNGTFDLIIVASNLYKYGSSRSVGSIVPSPFKISKEGRLTTATFMGEYDQDRFELTIVAKEIEHPGREASTQVIIWVYRPEQLVRVIMSRPPTEVAQEKEEIVSELRNATAKRIVVNEIRHHVNSMGRIRMDWCDMYFHAVDPETNSIVPVDDVLKDIDNNYDFLKDYYAGFAIENIVPAHAKFVEEKVDLALIGLLALLVVLFVGAISFMVLCCCLKNWNMAIPPQTRRKEALIKKQFIDELSTTENPLWIEQKMKMYEEQELTMQVFSEPEIVTNESDLIQPASPFGRRDSYEVSQMGDNTYATIQPRNPVHLMANVDSHGPPRLRNSSSVSTIGNGEIAEYATLRNVGSGHPPSTTQLYEFTGSTFQALTQHDDGNYVAEII